MFIIIKNIISVRNLKKSPTYIIDNVFPIYINFWSCIYKSQRGLMVACILLDLGTPGSIPG